MFQKGDFTEKAHHTYKEGKYLFTVPKYDRMDNALVGELLGSDLLPVTH
jgi:hypothetical protein